MDLAKVSTAQEQTLHSRNGVLVSSALSRPSAAAGDGAEVSGLSVRLM